MKRIRGIKTYRFDTGMHIATGYCTHKVNVMITEDRDRCEATMYCDDMGISMFMFGIPKRFQTFEDFLDTVESNVPEYIRMYEHYLDACEKGW